METVERERSQAEGIGGEPLLSVLLLAGLRPVGGASSSTRRCGHPGSRQKRSRRYTHGSMRWSPQLASNDTKVVSTVAAFRP